MKKAIYFISVLAFALVTNSFGQKPTIELTFTAQYQTQYVMLDSIYVENLTQGGDTTLYAPDTVMVLDYITGVAGNPALNEGFRVSQNRPNPFAEQTIISIFLPEADHLQVSVINLLGQKVAFFERSLDSGSHSFVFYPGDDRYYILTATANGLTKTIKMLSLNNHSSKQVLLNYQGKNEIQPGYKSSEETNDFGYSLGDQLRFIGFAKNPSDIAGSDVIEATPVGNEEYVFEIIEGIPCSGTPTVTYEGQTYKTVQIDTQCWFKENLNVGTMIPEPELMADNGIIEKYCYNNEQDSCTTYGGLYQWDEMMQYVTTPGVQGICPSGWHIPTDTEWCTLAQFIDPTVDCNETGWSGTDVGIKMKSTTGWYYGGNGTNTSGFTALPGGNHDYIGYSYDVGFNAHFWPSTWGGNYGTVGWKLDYSNASVGRFGYYYPFGFSVRCLRDYEPPVSGFSGTPTAGIAPLTVNFTDQSSNNPASWQWDFGDGGTSTQQNPVHTYNSIGSYTVQLTVSNSIGYDTEIKTNYINVSPSPLPCPGTPTVTYEGQTYNTVQIGTQCWFKENLNVGTMIPGSQAMTDNGIIEKYCFDNDPANCTTYGGLYQWAEMMQYTIQQGAQGICPVGWHLPTDAEWCIVTQFIDPTVNCIEIGYSGTDVGIKMKSTTGWYYGGNGTNISGFTALPGGFRHVDGFFVSLITDAYFWSSTEFDSLGAWHRSFVYNFAIVSRFSSNKTFGNSIRCVQD